MEALTPAIQPVNRSRAERRNLLDALRTEFSGLTTEYPVAEGGTRVRTYLDSAASNLRFSVADDIARKALEHYANTHSRLHYGSRIMTEAYEHAHDIARDFVGAGDDYTAIFCGNGVTGCLNRMARVLNEKRDGRDVVITTLMEHHANDLPHRKHAGKVVHVPLERDPDGQAGRVDMHALRNAITDHADRLNYVAITAASNVTGVTNPIHEIAELAHEVGALIVVDAAQSAAHQPIQMEPDDGRAPLDVCCLSGHKIYAPGSPGVIIARKELFSGIEPQEVGGGIVGFVDARRYDIVDKLPDREETGTPNLPGAFSLAATLYLLGRIGMDVVEQDERELTQYALSKLQEIDDLHIYGSHRLEVADRIGVITFNLENLPHGLVTAALNDYFGVAVRNECFCAQPFVRQLLGIAGADGIAPDSCLDPCPAEEQPGMVRISLGLYNTRSDIDVAVEALQDIAARPEFYRKVYRPVGDGSGDWIHQSYRFNPEEAFDLRAEADAWLQQSE